MTPLLFAALVATTTLWGSAPPSHRVHAPMENPTPAFAAHAPQTVTYQIVTNEIKAVQPGGSNVEVYRFDPGVYVVHQGDQVNLQIRGLKGHDHPVILEGYDVRGMIRRNATTRLSFQATKPGTYRLICTAHADAAHEGPMEGYLIVLP